MDDDDGSSKKRPVQPLDPEIYTDDSATASDMDICTEILAHLACAEKALVQLRKNRCTDDDFDEEKARAYKNREKYHLSIQQSVNELLDEVEKLGPCLTHKFRPTAAETVRFGQSGYQDQFILGNDQLPASIPHNSRHRSILENHIYTSQHESAPKPIQRMVSPFLAKLPVELRRQIYHELLESPRSIRGGELVEEKAMTIVIRDIRQPHQLLAIDARILRTCREVYEEALPILYQFNHIGFRDVRSLRAFRSGGLTHVASSANTTMKVPAFGLSPNQHGRFSFVRHLSIRFSNKLSRSAAIENWIYKMRVGQEPQAHARGEWAELLHENQYATPANRISFPSLEDLFLDFSDWGMNKSEGLTTQPFLEMFKAEKPLKSVIVVGLYHVSTTGELEEGLVGRVGTLTVGPRVIHELEFWDKERPWMKYTPWVPGRGSGMW